MSRKHVVPVRRRRRSQAEIRQLVEEFVQSGLAQSEFCRQRGLVPHTLKRYLKKQREFGREPAGGALVAVEVEATSPNWTVCGLTVLLSSGRRIEVGAGFDAATLARLVAVLETL